jgi:hypothetical protein
VQYEVVNNYAKLMELVKWVVATNR